MPSINDMTPRSRAPTEAGALARAARRAGGMTQKEVAQLAGLSPRSVRRFESGDRPSADTANRLEQALGLPDNHLAPDWELPAKPDEPAYGSRLRARRRALGITLPELARAVNVSAAKLSRFENGLSIPHKWFAEWRDDADRDRIALIQMELAPALGFADVKELHEFCVCRNVSRWRVEGDRRSGLNYPDHGDPDVPADQAFPDMVELERARYLSARSRTRPQAPSTLAADS